MSELAQAPRLACIVFARMRDFTRKPVQQQARLAVQFHALVETVLAGLPADSHLVLDVPGGAAIVLPDDPATALAIAEDLHTCAPGMALCIGVNYGPVKLDEHGGGQELIGDGLQAAATTAEFATPQRWLAARAFRDVLQEAAPDQAGRLASAGVFTDARVRSHELYALDPAAARRRRMRVYGSTAVAVVLILLCGVAARLALHEGAAADGAESIDKGSTSTSSLHAPDVPAGQPAKVALQVRPWGDVWIDGELKGRAPPLTEIELKPGPHHVTVRNGNLPALETEIRLQSGERMTLTHRFGTGQRKSAAAPEAGGAAAWWHKARRSLGL